MIDISIFGRIRTRDDSGKYQRMYRVHADNLNKGMRQILRALKAMSDPRIEFCIVIVHSGVWMITLRTSN